MSIEISIKAQKIFQASIINNLALGFEPEIEYPRKWKVLERYLDAGVNYVSLHVATDATSLEKTVRYIAFITERITENAQRFLLVKTPQDILQAKAEHKLGIGFVFQGTNPIAKSLEMIDAYYQLGVRSMILCYNVRNDVGDGCVEVTDAGLSKFGSKVVERMNQVGMLIDVAHTGYKTSLDAMMQSKAPVIFSHSNVYALKQHPRNLRDDQIKACAATGGVIGINGIGVLLGDDNANPQKYVEHIDYIMQLVGAKHVSLGLDEIYFPELMEDFLKNNAVMYPQDYSAAMNAKTQQWNSMPPAKLIEVVELLLRKNYSEVDIKGILGENYMRVIQKVYK